MKMLTRKELIGIIIDQGYTIEQLEGKIKRLNAFLVERGLAIEYVKWNRGYDE